MPALPKGFPKAGALPAKAGTLPAKGVAPAVPAAAGHAHNYRF